MSKYFRLLIISTVLLLVGCSHPEDLAETATKLPTAVDKVLTPLPPATETTTPIITKTQLTYPTLTEPTQGPAAPTTDLLSILAVDLIPLLTENDAVTIREIHMITDQAGWGITRVEPEGDHILITRNGGEGWQDVTPPQPILDPEYWMMVDAGFVDENTAFIHYKNTDLVWVTSNGGVDWQSSTLDLNSRQGSMFTILDKDHAWLFQFLDSGMHHVYTALARTTDGGKTWTTLLDPYTDASIQSFDKTGADFINTQYGWLTTDSGGVAAYVDLQITQDGGESWQDIGMPSPPSEPDIFKDCACGLDDPHLEAIQQGTVRLVCRCGFGSEQVVHEYLYRTADGGANWEIYNIPEADRYYQQYEVGDGKLHSLSKWVHYMITRDIYHSTDGGASWEFTKHVNWNGQFSFVSNDLAWGVAYDPKDDEYALVKTTDGCQSFQILNPIMLASPLNR